jgi:hypothetical protein
VPLSYLNFSLFMNIPNDLNVFSIYIQGIAWSIHLFFNLSSASSLRVRKFCFKTCLFFIFEIKLKIRYIYIWNQIENKIYSDGSAFITFCLFICLKLLSNELTMRRLGPIILGLGQALSLDTYESSKLSDPLSMDIAKRWA